MGTHSYDADLELTLAVTMKDAVDKAHHEASTRLGNKMVVIYIFAVRKFGEVLVDQIPSIFSKISSSDIKPIDETHLEQRMLSFIDECFTAMEQTLDKYRISESAEKTSKDNPAYLKVKESVITGNNLLKSRFREEIKQQAKERKERFRTYFPVILGILGSVIGALLGAAVGAWATLYVAKLITWPFK